MFHVSSIMFSIRSPTRTWFGLRMVNPGRQRAERHRHFLGEFDSACRRADRGWRRRSAWMRVSASVDAGVQVREARRVDNRVGSSLVGLLSWSLFERLVGTTAPRRR